MKTKEQILKECKERIQGKLSMIYWSETVLQAMDEYAAQAVKKLNAPPVSGQSEERACEQLVCWNCGCKFPAERIVKRQCPNCQEVS